MQNKVKRFNDEREYHRKQMPVFARIVDIQSELGELGKEYLKNSKYGTEKFDLVDDFKMEFGDCLYSLFSLANETGINAEECLDLALKKYKQRLKDKQSMGSE